MNILDRISQPTPSFFKKLGSACLVIAAIGTAALSLPISIPVWVGATLIGIGTAGKVVTILTTEGDDVTKITQAEEVIKDGINQAKDGLKKE